MKSKQFCWLIASIILFSLLPMSSTHAESSNSQIWVYNSNNKLISHYTYSQDQQKVHKINTIIGQAGENADESSKVFPKMPQSTSVKRVYKLTDYRKKSTVTIYSNKTMFIDATGILVKVKLTPSQYKTLTEI